MGHMSKILNAYSEWKTGPIVEDDNHSPTRPSLNRQAQKKKTKVSHLAMTLLPPSSVTLFRTHTLSTPLPTLFAWPSPSTPTTAFGENTSACPGRSSTICANRLDAACLWLIAGPALDVPAPSISPSSTSSTPESDEAPLRLPPPAATAARAGIPAASSAPARCRRSARSHSGDVKRCTTVTLHRSSSLGDTPDCGQQLLRQRRRLAALIHVFVCLIQRHDASHASGVLLQEERQADVEERTRSFWRYLDAIKAKSARSLFPSIFFVWGSIECGRKLRSTTVSWPARGAQSLPTGLNTLAAFFSFFFPSVGKASADDAINDSRVSSRCVLAGEQRLESPVVERLACLLLAQAQVTQHTVDHVHVQRHGVALLHCHQVHHALGREVLLSNAKRLDGHAWEPRICPADGCHVGRRAQHTHAHSRWNTIPVSGCGNSFAAEVNRLFSSKHDSVWLLPDPWLPQMNVLEGAATL
ncbi:hypothetical protein N8I77_010658 [Diaporthe amygdali]|uniref:Uncharacterized protein n=1 Tax=Phomopsis amygdali TaxID=1214568 RepID=A0AAD9S8T5_PHOAM|nr:hypothetical protein N8I77_010658 [Diaporthe amygdali]